MLLGAITALCLVVYHVASDERMRRVDRELRSFERTMFRYLMAPEGKEVPTPAVVRERLKNLRPEGSMPTALKALFREGEASEPYCVAWDEDGSVLFRSANAPENLTLPQIEGNGGEMIRDENARREWFRLNPRGMSNVIGRDISRERDELARLALLLALSGAGIWLLGLVGGWWLAGRAIKPIAGIGRTASRIAGGNLAERIVVNETDSELGHLSQVLNDTFDRLESAIQRQKQFVADASHELRSPVSVILCETQRGLKRERSAEDYRDILSTCHHAAERMRTLVESLLILARQEEETEGSVIERCDLRSIAAEAVTLLQPLADDHDIELTTDFTSAPLVGSSRAFQLVVANLISNAIHHQPSGGKVRVRVTIEGDQAVLEVSDTGPGIEAVHLPRLFDRFYRVDKARGSTGGHSGLGLAIVRAVLDRYRGKVEVTSEPGQGSTFKVMIPSRLNPAA
jgi:two-component system OmpR family sensor kinase